jgi:ribonucleoside-diphosphate reductase alpha chain
LEQDTQAIKEQKVDQDIQVIKRDGTRESIDLEKIHRVVHWASQDLENISVSQVEINSQLAFFDGIKTEDIHETIIKSAADLISTDVPDYQYLAARLTIFHLRKKAFKSFTPPSLIHHVINLTDLGIYDKDILKKYNKTEFKELDNYIDHWRDMNFSYAAVKQLEGKYLVQNRVTGEIFESPQFLYMLVGMCLFQEYKGKARLDFVKRFYDATSTFKISLPTPIMAGVRTPTRQFSSCVLIETDDDLDSISASSAAIVKYVSQRAGIGINAGRIRALGSPIRGGEATHTGCIPFFKHFHTAVKSCSQGGVRGGAATLFYPLWHLEVESLLVLKNNTGTDENRIRHLDYGVQFNGLMYQRFLADGDITLFSPNDVPGLYDAFFADQTKFKKLYEKYEKDKTIRKEKIKARDLFSKFMKERANTGRIYLQNVDHCNTHGAFDANLAPIKQSNLCMEITLPTKPLYSVQDENGEVALCTLSAVNLGALDSLDELEDITEIIVRSLDSLLDYQNYPLKAAELTSKNRRTLGIGVTNLAYYLAKNNAKYSDGSGNELIHKTFEAFRE